MLLLNNHPHVAAQTKNATVVDAYPYVWMMASALCIPSLIEIPVDNASIALRIQNARNAAEVITPEHRHELVELAITMTDLTTLEGTDTEDVVQALSRRALIPAPGLPSTAAVCVYPNLVSAAKVILSGTSVRVASVAGGFPHGQTALSARISEIKHAVAAGADEIDIVISRKLFLEGSKNQCESEILQMREACIGSTLKVIVETGELKDHNLIREASLRAIRAGADFIKTSTGKTPINATPEVTLVMLDVIKDYFDASGEKIRMKPAGGIRTADDAVFYLTLVEQTLGEEWLSSKMFRFGASSLLSSLVDELTGTDSTSPSAAY